MRIEREEKGIIHAEEVTQEISMGKNTVEETETVTGPPTIITPGNEVEVEVEDIEVETETESETDMENGENESIYYNLTQTNIPLCPYPHSIPVGHPPAVTVRVPFPFPVPVSVPVHKLSTALADNNININNINNHHNVPMEFQNGAETEIEDSILICTEDKNEEYCRSDDNGSSSDDDEDEIETENGNIIVDDDDSSSDVDSDSTITNEKIVPFLIVETEALPGENENEPHYLAIESKPKPISSKSESESESDSSHILNSNSNPAAYCLRDIDIMDMDLDLDLDLETEAVVSSLKTTALSNQMPNSISNSTAESTTDLCSSSSSSNSNSSSSSSSSPRTSTPRGRNESDEESEAPTHISVQHHRQEQEEQDCDRNTKAKMTHIASLSPSPSPSRTGTRTRARTTFDLFSSSSCSSGSSFNFNGTATQSTTTEANTTTNNTAHLLLIGSIKGSRRSSGGSTGGSSSSRSECGPNRIPNRSPSEDQVRDSKPEEQQQQQLQSQSQSRIRNRDRNSNRNHVSSGSSSFSDSHSHSHSHSHTQGSPARDGFNKGNGVYTTSSQLRRRDPERPPGRIAKGKKTNTPISRLAWDLNVNLPFESQDEFQFQFQDEHQSQSQDQDQSSSESESESASTESSEESENSVKVEATVDGKAEAKSETEAETETEAEADEGVAETLLDVDVDDVGWRRNEWNEEIDQVPNQSHRRSGHGHAPGETGISTRSVPRTRESCWSWSEKRREQKGSSFDLLTRTRTTEETEKKKKTKKKTKKSHQLVDEEEVDEEQQLPPSCPSLTSTSTSSNAEIQADTEAEADTDKQTDEALPLLLPIPSSARPPSPSPHTERGARRQVQLSNLEKGEQSPNQEDRGEEEDSESEIISSPLPLQEEDASSQHVVNFSSSFTDPHHCRRRRPQQDPPTPPSPPPPHGDNLSPLDQHHRTRTRREPSCETIITSPSSPNNKRICNNKNNKSSCSSISESVSESEAEFHSSSSTNNNNCNNSINKNRSSVHTNNNNYYIDPDGECQCRQCGRCIKCECELFRREKGDDKNWSRSSSCSTAGDNTKNAACSPQPLSSNLADTSNVPLCTTHLISQDQNEPLNEDDLNPRNTNTAAPGPGPGAPGATGARSTPTPIPIRSILNANHLGNSPSKKRKKKQVRFNLTTESSDQDTSEQIEVIESIDQDSDYYDVNRNPHQNVIIIVEGTKTIKKKTSLKYLQQLQSHHQSDQSHPTPHVSQAEDLDSDLDFDFDFNFDLEVLVLLPEDILQGSFLQQQIEDFNSEEGTFDNTPISQVKGDETDCETENKTETETETETESESDNETDPEIDDRDCINGFSHRGKKKEGSTTQEKQENNNNTDDDTASVEVTEVPTFLKGQKNQTETKGEKKVSFLPHTPDNIAMQQRLSSTEHMRLRSVLRKPGHSKKQRGRSVTFNESLNLFYEAECSCWVHEDEYAKMRQEEHERREREEIFHYEPPPIEFDDPPTLSPPEGYKDRFFPQEMPLDPDVTRVTPPSPPAARRKVFLKDNPVTNGQEDEEDAEDSRKSKTSRLGGILKGGRLWRSNSAEGKKVTSPQEEPDVVKCTESRYITILDDDLFGQENTSSHLQHQLTGGIGGGGIGGGGIGGGPQGELSAPLKVSTGTAPLRTSEQIRLAVDSTLRFRANKKKPECSSLVEKLRWLTSLDDDDSSDSNTSGFATWPSRDKNGTLTKSSTGGNGKADAGTSTTEEFVQSAIIRQPPISTANEAKIKQISYTLEDIDEGLKSGENELESFITEDGGRIERLRKRYGDDLGGDDYGFSRRPSVKGIKPKFSSTNQIFAQFTMRKSETPIPQMSESQYENTRSGGGGGSISMDPNNSSIINSANNCNSNNSNPNPNPSATPNSMALLDNARILNYEFANAPGRQSEESRAHFEMIRQSFEPGAYVNFNRPHSWSVSTLPHPHHTAHHAHTHSHSMCLMAGGGGGGGPGPANNQGPPQQINNGAGNNSIIPSSGVGAGAGPGAGTGVGGSLSGQGQQQQGSMVAPGNSGVINSQLLQQQQQQQQQQANQQQQSQQLQQPLCPMPNSIPIMAATGQLPQSQYATMVNNGGMGMVNPHSLYGTHQNNAAAMYGTLPHPHQHQQNQHQLNSSVVSGGGGGGVGQQQAIYGTLQNNLNGPGMGQCVGVNGGLGNQQQQQQQQQMYGTVRRVPNVIGRPLFLHYGALSVEAHPNKIPYPRNAVPETPSPTQQPPPIRYYGPPIRYYNPPPPVPPRTAASAPSSSATIAGAVINVSMNCTPGKSISATTMMNVADHERGVPEGATDEEPGVKEPYSMNI